MYVSALVCTRIYWYVQVHTSQELVCTGTDQYKRVHTGMYLHKRIYDILTIVHTGLYQYIRVHTGIIRHVYGKKNCMQVSNARSSAYCLQNLPLHYGGTDLDA